VLYDIYVRFNNTMCHLWLQSSDVVHLNSVMKSVSLVIVKQVCSIWRT